MPTIINTGHDAKPAPVATALTPDDAGMTVPVKIQNIDATVSNMNAAVQGSGNSTVDTADRIEQIEESNRE